MLRSRFFGLPRDTERQNCREIDRRRI